MSKPVPIPARESVSHVQIGAVLDIISALQPYMLQSHREIDGNLPKSLDGGVGAGATTTFLKACARLDSILDDSSRWSLAPYDELAMLMSDLHLKQSEFLEAQIESTKEVQRPSFQLRPVLAVGNDKFLAIWGNPETPGSALIGIGDTPAEALRDFDKAFTRKVEQQHQIQATFESSDELPAKTPKPKIKKKGAK